MAGVPGYSATFEIFPQSALPIAARQHEVSYLFFAALPFDAIFFFVVGFGFFAATYA